GPEKEYYWEKLYPGLDKYSGNLTPLTAGAVQNNAVEASRSLNADMVEGQLGGMLDELQSMSKSLGSLKALQEVDFGETSQQLKAAHNFYSKLNDAMATLSETVEDTKEYKQNLASLNTNLTSLNGVYGNMLNAMTLRS
ncbi:MAG: gliding motility protein GldL, partial [Bacteroidota bacterium]